MKYLYLILFLAVFFSCSKKVDLDLPDVDKKIVISSFIQPDSIIKVLVSHPIGILETGNPILSNATVDLYKNNGFVEQLQFDNDLYKSTFVAEENTKYKIKVIANTYPVVTAVDSVPDSPVLLEADFNKNYLIEYNDEGQVNYIGRLKCKIFDDLSHINYYEIKIYHKYWSDYDQSFHSNSFSFKKNECEIINNEDIIEYKPSFVVFSNRLFTSQQQIINLDVNMYNQLDINNSGEIIVVLKKISKAYYQYKKSYLLHYYYQNSDGDFWGSPIPINLYTNVTNGLGIFAAFNETRVIMPF